MSWTDDLQRASWRGVPFFVNAATIRAGRNTAVHAYPYREKSVVWVEDLGLAPRRLQFIGFLVGDNIAAQQDEMLAAVELAGSGDLVHPLVGLLTGVVVEFSTTLRRDKGGAVELTFDFIQQDDGSPYPASATDTAGAVADAAVVARTSTLGDLASSVGQGLRSAQMAVREVQAVGRQALSIARSATSLVGAVGVLPGNFGRFIGGGGAIGGVFRGLSTVSSALSTASSLGARVTSTVGNLQRLAARL